VNIYSTRRLASPMHTGPAAHSRFQTVGEAYQVPSWLYKIFFHLEAFVHESIILLLPTPSCVARTIAIRLHVYCQSTTSPRPLCCVPYTIQYWYWQYRVKAKCRERLAVRVYYPTPPPSKTANNSNTPRSAVTHCIGPASTSSRGTATEENGRVQ